MVRACASLKLLINRSNTTVADERTTTTRMVLEFVLPSSNVQSNHSTRWVVDLIETAAARFQCMSDLFCVTSQKGSRRRLSSARLL